jgi:hypothetical protein
MLVLDTQSTHQQNGCQTVHEQKVKEKECRDAAPCM